MNYLSVCSGIEAATVAWAPLGWQAVAFSEIDAFPCAVLAHHYPDVPNRGDLTRFQEWPDAVVDVLVGGTPCQSFSVAGLRAGLDDPRGSLLLVYLALARRMRPRWLVWENVPGVLSSDGGRAFGSLLGGLAELGYGFAYRILDAQYFGLAQRRKRVFVVGHLGDWRRAAAVLFERASLSGHPAPRRETGQVAPTVPARRTAGGGYGTGLHMRGQIDAMFDGALVAQTLNGHSGRNHLEADYIPIGFCNTGGDTALGLDIDGGLTMPPITTRHGDPGCVAFSEKRGELTVNDTAGSLKVGGGKPGQGYPAIAQHMAVRRLTPRECERLQGFPDDYTRIPYRGKPASDGPRYKALGNSMAVPVMAWIGRRIAAVEAL